MKVRYCFYGLLILICAFVPFRQSSTEITLLNTTPCICIKSWTVGQSSGYWGKAKRPLNMGSFITNSEETNCIEVSVGYCDDQPSPLNIMYPITSFEFQLSMSHGFVVEKMVYSVSGPDASLFDPSTGFSVKAKFKGPQDTEGLACAQNGRDNKPIVFNAKFIGYYGSEPDNPKTVTVEGKWYQDTKDMIRQEYVDMTPTLRPRTNKIRAELPVPSKDSFVDTISTDNGVDSWNTGHYSSYMIDDGLKNKKSSWLAKVNELYRRNRVASDGTKLPDLPDFTDTDFQVNSGYRNPYHQRFHVGSNAFHSRHPYGDALDIQTLDVDGDGLGPNGIEQVHGDESLSDDGVAMQEAAEAAGAKYTASWKDYTSQHTHADWTSRSSWPPPDEAVFSPPCEIDGTAADGPCVTCAPSSGSSADEADEGDTGGTQETPSTPSYHACGIHATSVSGDHTWGTFACGDATHVGYLCQASSDHSITISGWSGTFYECQPHQAFVCGHTDLTANAYTHRLESCPPNSNGDSCTAGSSYACSSHTHVYPAIVCGAASWTGCTASISSRTEHQTACRNCPESYWTCSTSGVAWHATPLTCQRSGCSVSLTKCQNTGGGGCFSNGTEYRYHDLP